MTVPTRPPSRKPSSTRNLKLLLTTLSVTTTLSGWAAIALNQPASADQVAADDPAPATEQPVPLVSPTEVPAPATGQVQQAQLIIPPLSSLPVRGLRSVGKATSAAVLAQPAQVAVLVQRTAPLAAAPASSAGSVSVSAPPPAAPPPAPPPPAPKPKPPPVSHSKGSHP